MAFLPGGGMLITERGGGLFRYRNGTLEEVSGVPRIAATGQGGLLDVALHPGFETNRYVYFTYSSRYGGGAGTALGRGRLTGDRLSQVEELFRINRPTIGGRHFGSRLVFGPDGYIYLSVGDRGARDRAQDTGDHAGSVLRLTGEGKIPPGNPYRSDADALDELYTIGHRNIQGMAVHPETGEIWTHEHGPQGGDEINRLEGGKNYGWPVISYGDEYGSGTPVGPNRAPGLEQPILYWTPSIAPSGMTFYTGGHFPGWEGDLFVGALAGRHLRRVRIRNDRVVEQEVLLSGVIGRIRDVRLGPDGKLYILTDERNGGLYRIDP
jgi:glucose/arabinose dehydrogenase